MVRRCLTSTIVVGTAMNIERDDSRQRIIATGNGTISISDIRSVVDQQRTDGTWHYGLLYDFGDATTSVTGDEMRSLALYIKGLRPTARGPIVVVATDPSFYGVARM